MPLEQAHLRSGPGGGNGGGNPGGTATADNHIRIGPDRDLVGRLGKKAGGGGCFGFGTGG